MNSNDNKNKLYNLRKSLFLSDKFDQKSSIIDYFETFDKPEKDLNNYADVILKNVKNLNNVSDQWKSNINSEKIVTSFMKRFHTCNMDSRTISVTDEARKYACSVKSNSIHENEIDNLSTEIISYNYKSLKNNSNEESGKLSFGKTDNLTVSNKSINSLKRPLEVNENFKRTFNLNYSKNINIADPKPLKIINRNDIINQETIINNQVDNSQDFPFRSAREQLNRDLLKKNSSPSSSITSIYGNNKKSLGTRRGARSEFIPPINNVKTDQISSEKSSTTLNSSPRLVSTNSNINDKCLSLIGDERLKQFQSEMIELILSEIMDSAKSVTWNDICGLEAAKNILQEIVVFPMLRPDIFTGLRGPPKGLLLFGPPGTGKTLIGKCIAAHSKSTFFSISASSLTSKWVGEGEKMVRALFTIAKLLQPSVIFIDEIDSLLTQRSESEHESSRRMKTEFLVQLDGVGTGNEDRVLLVGATNRPQEIDEAARRRFVKRLYIPLPSAEARKDIIINLLIGQSYSISASEIDVLVNNSEGYSGADVANLCKEAAMGPIRCLRFDQFENISLNDVRAITFNDFEEALKNVKSSVSPDDLQQYIRWNSIYGSYQIM